jgi:hypothetical protein
MRVTRGRVTEDLEHCGLCNAALAPTHQHLLHRTERQIVCSCDSCAMVFCGQNGAHYLRVPRRIRSLIGFSLSDLHWESMMIPINLAFFCYDSAESRMKAMYPSPAGAVESLLSLETWTDIAADHPALASMEPDIETFLVNRVDPVPRYYIVPIDECFRLVGLIRLHWRGLSGGAEVWKQVNDFFANLQARATEVTESTHA